MGLQISHMAMCQQPCGTVSAAMRHRVNSLICMIFEKRVVAMQIACLKGLYILDYCLPICSMLHIIDTSWFHEGLDRRLFMLPSQSLKLLCCIHQKRVRMNHADGMLFAGLDLHRPPRRKYMCSEIICCECSSIASAKHECVHAHQADFPGSSFMVLITQRISGQQTCIPSKTLYQGGIVSSQKSHAKSTMHSCQSQVTLVFQADQPEAVEKMVQRPTPRKKAEEKVLYDFLSSIAFECSCSAILVTSPSASLHATTLLHVLSYYPCNRHGIGKVSHKVTPNQQETLITAGTHKCCMAAAYSTLNV